MIKFLSIFFVLLSIASFGNDKNLTCAPYTFDQKSKACLLHLKKAEDSIKIKFKAILTDSEYECSMKCEEWGKESKSYYQQNLNKLASGN